MQRCALYVVLLLSICSLGTAIAQPPPPPEYALEQNDPNPFCGYTSIAFALPRQAEVNLSVWDPDSTMAIRSLIEGTLPPGYHSVYWDGRDQGGSLLPNGLYPYVLTAVEEPGAPPIFVASLRATIECATPIESRTWGAIKTLYHEPDARGNAER